MIKTAGNMILGASRPEKIMFGVAFSNNIDDETGRGHTEFNILPASAKGVAAAMSLMKMLIDSINQFTCVPSLRKYLGQEESFDEVNYLAALLASIPDDKYETFLAALEYGKHTGSVMDLINLAQNLDCYELYENVADLNGLDGKHVDNGYIVYKGGFVEYYNREDRLPFELRILPGQTMNPM